MKRKKSLNKYASAIPCVPVGWSYQDAVEFIEEYGDAYLPCRKCSEFIRIQELHPLSIMKDEQDDLHGLCTACGGPARLKGKRRRARQQTAQGSYTAAEWKALCDYYDNRCLCCGERVALTADHVRPLSMGGSNDIGNIQPLCGVCNSSKGAKVVDYRY